MLNKCKQGGVCTTVVLTSLVVGAYDIEEEIIVTRRITVTGSPGSLPIINAKEASRAFRVKVKWFIFSRRCMYALQPAKS